MYNSQRRLAQNNLKLEGDRSRKHWIAFPLRKLLVESLSNACGGLRWTGAGRIHS
ncbi:hypothetical protein H6G86_25325 [Nostoc sp. FACHB-133]|nr:hypothetical protein [Nostoc sp. FACHB-133]